MMRILAMGLFGFLFGCDAGVSSAPETSRGEAVHLAALNVIVDDFRVTSVWPGDSESTINAMQARIDAARGWTRANVTDRAVAAEYNGWLDFYEKRVGEARSELTTHARQLRMEKYDRELKERWGRAGEVQQTLPRPRR